MTAKSCLFVFSIFTATTLRAAELPSFDTSWIPAKPEMLTYHSKSKQGDGLYQVSNSRNEGAIDLYMNIITPGFTKSVWGTMSTDMRPRGSKSRIVVQDQITMTTDCSYGPATLHIATLMAPYKKIMENNLSCSNLVVDFSQAPLLARTLPLKPGAELKFTSLNPQANALVPLTIHVVASETIHSTECYKIEAHDFEGEAAYWIEKAGHHRVMRIEQPATGRITELIL